MTTNSINSIQLPSENLVLQPTPILDSTISEEFKEPLMSFSSDGKTLTSEDILRAYKYFAAKEKEITVVGKKGDGIIEREDVEELINTDDKFKNIKDKYNNNAVSLLTNVIKTLVDLVYNPYDQNSVIERIEPGRTQGYSSKNKKGYVINHLSQ